MVKIVSRQSSKVEVNKRTTYVNLSKNLKLYFDSKDLSILSSNFYQVQESNWNESESKISSYRSYE